jgi:hypothetical protein
MKPGLLDHVALTTTHSTSILILSLSYYPSTRESHTLHHGSIQQLCLVGDQRYDTGSLCHLLGSNAPILPCELQMERK